jgi:hypothetical protein
MIIHRNLYLMRKFIRNSIILDIYAKVSYFFNKKLCFITILIIYIYILAMIKPKICYFGEKNKILIYDI